MINDRIQNEIDRTEAGYIKGNPTITYLIDRQEKLEAVLEAAEKLHANIADGNNGPPQWCNEEWYALDEAIKAARETEK